MFFKETIQDKYTKYRFEFRHLTILVIVLILFQITLALIQKSSLNNFLNDTQQWYQRHSAEKLALITSTSMELLFENMYFNKNISLLHERKLTASFNVIFKQQLLQRDVKEICLILIKDNELYVIDNGVMLYAFFTNNLKAFENRSLQHKEAVRKFLQIKDKMKNSEIIQSSVENMRTFNIFVPFVPNGEYLGVMYMKIAPDFSFFTNEVSSSFDKVAIIYSSLILLGLLAIYIASSRAVKERNKVQELFFKEHEEKIKEQIRHEKESLFTKRIYHTHHKAEKIMGFIKEDLRQMNSDNIEDIKKRVTTYSNFISRIIYDMKWYDQPINTIINPMFNTEINSVIKFIVQYLFLRISSKNDMFVFELNHDDKLPIVHVNEFIVWEILEPLIQNSIDHGGKRHIKIIITTSYNPQTRNTSIVISDNGVGITPELLTLGANGRKKIFNENESTKKIDGTKSGYGCYISYQMAVERCGWQLDAENLTDAGAKFTINILN
jgi:hypothetical protein